VINLNAPALAGDERRKVFFKRLGRMFYQFRKDHLFSSETSIAK
jgi:hypothetical protein